MNWYDVLGFNGYYLVSDDGQVKSVDRVVRTGHGGTAVRKGRIIKDRPDKDGYRIITLSKENKQYTFKVHKLVYEAIKGPVPEGYVINHINEDKADNRIENLCAVTQKDNINWGTHNERMKKNMTGPYTSKRVAQYDKDGNLLGVYESEREAARITGVDQGYIGKVCNKKPHHLSTGNGVTWKFI